MTVYRRYDIETRPAPDLTPHPSRFRVDVRKARLIGLVLKELVEYRGRLQAAMSRPCVYGVFSGPVGGLAPREGLCVGCLRCTVQYPGIVQIRPNPARASLGGGHLTPDQVDTILYEARTGRVPVRGAGYRGRFGGEGWDGMWTDMSEIVRPTRDGIHGREFISTFTEIGEKPPYLEIDRHAKSVGPEPRVLGIQVPFLFDIPPPAVRTATVLGVLAEAARRIDTLAIVPAALATGLLRGPHVVPLLGPDEAASSERLGWVPRMVLLDGWDRGRFETVARRLAGSLVGVRVPAGADVVALVQEGARILHLVADPSGRAGSRFVADAVQDAHRRLVEAGRREEVTLIGSGGIVLAEHVPKAILCGLDAVALDTALLVALQARFDGGSRGARERQEARGGGEVPGASVAFPRLEHAWGVQRIVNLAAAWRDQLLEVLGAMGLREVRRLRGETGRLMFQKDLEREAFAGIDGFEARPA